MGPLDLVQLTALTERASGRAEINVGLIDGPVQLTYPELASEHIREVNDNSCICWLVFQLVWSSLSNLTRQKPMRVIHRFPHSKVQATLIACSLLCLCGNAWCGETSIVTHKTIEDVVPLGASSHSLSFEYANFDAPIAGVAGGNEIVFVGKPLNGSVIALSRVTGNQIGELPAPPNGFAVPFIIHSLGKAKVAVLDAGGLPQPKPFVPTSPSIYEYTYSLSPEGGFAASLVRTISFASVLIGFSEDFVHLDDGRYLLSDAVLGSIWVAQPDGSISRGIVPKTFNPEDLIPTLAFGPTMPEITVNGYPFLFTGSTLPGVSPLAVRDGTVYYYSPAARGLYAFPLAVLSDNRPPYQRAANIYLVAPTPANVEVEELLDFSFNPYNPLDRYLYAADALRLRIIRINPTNGARQVVASGPQLFDFPSSLGFLPSIGPVSELVIVSNQQERTPLTNDAVSQTTFNLPFIVSKILITP
jgi:hypothetical protein